MCASTAFALALAHADARAIEPALALARIAVQLRPGHIWWLFDLIGTLIERNC